MTTEIVSLPETVVRNFVSRLTAGEIFDAVVGYEGDRVELDAALHGPDATNRIAELVNEHRKRNNQPQGNQA